MIGGPPVPFQQFGYQNPQPYHPPQPKAYQSAPRPVVASNPLPPPEMPAPTRVPVPVPAAAAAFPTPDQLGVSLGEPAATPAAFPTPDQLGVRLE